MSINWSLNKLATRKMRSIFFVLVLFAFTSKMLIAQESSDGIKTLDKYQVIALLIQDEAWEEALDRLREDQSSLAYLFRAKIYYRTGSLTESWKNLTQIRQYELDAKAKNEYYFTRLYTSIHLSKYNEAFDAMEILTASKTIGADEKKLLEGLYDYLLFLPASQARVNLVQSIKNSSIAADLARRSVYLSAPHILEDISEKYILRDDAKASVINLLAKSMQDTTAYIEECLSQQNTFNDNVGIDLGLALPLFDEETPEFDIIQGLYNGIKLAAESIDSTQKVYFELFDTTNPTPFKEKLERSLRQNNLDLIIGPLFSENLSLAATFDNPYKTPIFAPLANTINVANQVEWIFQLNPGFPNRGAQAAEYFLKNYAELDTVLIIAEKGSLGERSALAFRNRIEKDSIQISSYLVEDFAAAGYDLRLYSDLFTTDSTLIDSLGITPFKAVYAPFSGSTTETMINLLLTGLESQQNFPLIMGSGEWQNYELSGFQALRFEIIYDSFQLTDLSTPELEGFLKLYESRIGKAPNDQALLGYDLGNYLLQGIQQFGSVQRFFDMMPYLAEYQGLSIKIDFSQSRYNRSMQYSKLSN